MNKYWTKVYHLHPNKRSPVESWIKWRSIRSNRLTLNRVLHGFGCVYVITEDVFDNTFFGKVLNIIKFKLNSLYTVMRLQHKFVT